MNHPISPPFNPPSSDAINIPPTSTKAEARIISHNLGELYPDSIGVPSPLLLPSAIIALLHHR